MSVERRAGDIRALVGEHTAGPLADLFAAVVCDGCGVHVAAESASELARLTGEWSIGSALGRPDYCPGCRP